MKIVATFFAILLTIPLVTFSQVPSEIRNDSYKIKDKDIDIIEKYPTWLIIEYAKQFRNNGDISTALVYLMKAQEKSYDSPDVLFELGILYKDMQDYEVSLNYFDKTLKKLESRSKTEQDIMKYTTYYEIADIYFFQKKYKQYEDTLKLIVKDEYMEQNAKNLLESQYINTLTGKRSFIEKRELIPLDEIIYLYRLKDDFSQKAHRLLGAYYINNGNYELAMKHNLIVVLKVYTRIIEEIKKTHVGFEFESSQALFDFIKQNNNYELYLHTSELHHAMIDLGLAVFGYEPSNIVLYSSRGIWTLVSDYGEVEDKKTANILLSLDNPNLRKYLLTLLKNFSFRA